MVFESATYAFLEHSKYCTLDSENRVPVIVYNLVEINALENPLNFFLSWLQRTLDNIVYELMQTVHRML